MSTSSIEVLRRWLALPLACLSISISTSSFSQDDYQPHVAEASRDGELALQGFVLPEGMTGSLVAAEPDVANPVAFYVANDGSIYVCETFRQERGVEDNRSHMNWLHADLSLESVEERVAMFKRFMGDSVNTWATEHDRIRLLRDTDGDGKPDRTTVFATGFNNIEDGTGAGVIEFNGRVYYTCIPRLWMMEDADNDGVADNVEGLHYGYGVRVAFRGHDMHGLVVGPDGRLYFSIGDRGYNVITREGNRLHRPDTGAVFRCDPDGSHLEVFAYGLRNPQELAFDDDGNLFTGDNNSDSGDQARWVYVVQDGDTGWRMYYQYLDDRGPWNRERIWYPFQADETTTEVQPACTLPPVANLADGPSGLTYYPGVGLPDRYRNHFFLADFRGTTGNSGIRSFTVKPKGASWELDDSHQFIWSILATDVQFAPDGSLYASDWVNGWVGEGKGRLYRFVNEQAQQTVTENGSVRLLAGAIRDLGTAELRELLSNPDGRVRQGAQFELVRRNALDELKEEASLPANDLRARHAVWGCLQLGLASPKTAVAACEVAETILKNGSSSESLQVHAFRLVCDLADRHGLVFLPSNLRAELADLAAARTKSPNARLSGFAAVTLGKLGTAADAATLLQLLDRANNQDAVVRHQGSMGLHYLAEREPGLLSTLVGHPGDAGRLGIVLAMRRQQDPAVAEFLADADSRVIMEAARAINDEPIESAQPALAALIERPGLSDVTMRRALNACYRLGTAEHAAAVAQVAADSSVHPAVRRVAAGLVESWNTTTPIDSVTGRWRPLPQREVSQLADAVRPHLPGMLAGPEAVRETSIRIASQLEITDVIPTLHELLKHDQNPLALRVSAFQALAVLEPDVDSLLQRGLNDASESIRMAALQVLAKRRPDDAVNPLEQALGKGSVEARQRSVQLLAEIGNPKADAILLGAFSSLQENQLPPGVTLDVLDAAERRGTDELRGAAREWRRRQEEVGTTLAKWSECLEGGNAERGREIFFGRSAASCRRCHKVAGSGGEVGPDLSKIGKEKDRQYLLEAIVDPNAKIAKGFETAVILTNEGHVVAGIVRSEDDQTLQLMTPQGAIVTVAKEDVDDRTVGVSGMPADISKNLSRAEIRDLVEFLSGLQTESSGAHGTSDE
ncbi:MAG: HEAT repeat domain-containing protein [Planctomycetaceae bacterium]|nr:HEAT repeat domain-containing protein [Planctomycetaceae bacterium]